MADTQPSPSTDPLAWWREARFGLFIHWGLYAKPAGFWKGQAIPSLGEWIMRNAKIPIPEYEAIANEFNPANFDAEQWVSMAADAGMKYLVITAKHHDGFGMYHSPSCPYNIVDATPFDRDPMKELAEACARHGLRMCFYYSQAQDWHAPGGAGHWELAKGQNWTRQDIDPEAFVQYLEDKVKPQVTELLTQYGPIGLIWFDTPVAITKEQSLELKELVHSLQPDCLVSGRVGHEVGDYGSLGDNQIPRGPVVGAWETPATMNDTWGFKSDDHNWKSVEDLLYLLVDLASKGVNYLLNVGPTALGEIPQPSIERLAAIGDWMDVNGEAIYGTSPNPFPFEFEWGRITAKEDRLYLLFTTWPERFELSGLRSEVKRVSLLAEPETAIPFVQSTNAGLDHHSLRLDLPDAPEPLVSVVCVELSDPLDVDASLVQQPTGALELPAYLALRHEPAEGELSLSRNGAITGWKTTDAMLSWRFKLLQPGRFTVHAVLGPNQHSKAKPGCTVRIELDGQAVSGPLTTEQRVSSPRAQYFPEYTTAIGEVRLSEPGWIEVRLRAVEIPESCTDGLTACAVALKPSS